MSRRKTLEERVKARPLGVWPFHHIVRAEFNRLERQVRKIRKEVERPKGAIDAGYKTALTDVLALIKEAAR